MKVSIHDITYIMGVNNSSINCMEYVNVRVL